MICKNSRSPKEFVCKRVVAMEGDKVFNTETNTFCHVSCVVENAFNTEMDTFCHMIYMRCAEKKAFNTETDTFCQLNCKQSVKHRNRLLFLN